MNRYIVSKSIHFFKQVFALDLTSFIRFFIEPVRSLIIGYRLVHRATLWRKPAPKCNKKQIFENSIFKGRNSSWLDVYI